MQLQVTNICSVRIGVLYLNLFSKQLATPYKKVGDNVDILWQTSRTVVNQIMVDNFASLSYYPTPIQSD